MPPPTAAQVLGGFWAALAGGDLGTDAASRDLACKVRARWPDLPAQVQAARRFHSAAARQAVDGGIRRVIFAAAGVPVVRPGWAGSFPLHAEAARSAPDARFCYADPGEEAVLLTRALYGSGQVSAVQGTIRDPQAITAAAGFGPPLHAQIQAALTWVPGRQAQAIIAAWADVIGPGGSLALSVAVGAGAWRARGLPAVQHHSVTAVLSWLTGAGLTVTEPGVVPVQTWPFGRPVSRRRPQICGVIARCGG